MRYVPTVLVLSLLASAAAAQPANDAFFSSEAIPFFDFYDTATTTLATTEGGEDLSPSCVGADMGKTVWWFVTVSTTTRIRFYTNGSNFDTVLAVYTEQFGSPNTEIGCSDDDGPGSTSDLTVTVSAGTYLVQIGSYGNGAGGNLILDVLSPPNDTHWGGATGLVTSTPFADGPYETDAADGEELEELAPSCVTINMDKTVWYTYTAPGNIDRIRADSRNSSYDTVLAVYTGLWTQETEVACGDDIDGSSNRQSEVTFTPTGGTEYHFQLGAYGTNAGGQVRFALQTADCGNSVVEVGEDCDDGGTLGGDCCSATCQYEPNGSSCSDGDVCTLSDTCNAVGVCVSGALDPCSDGNICTNDICVSPTGCSNPNNSLPCNDGLFCNGLDVCAGGLCAHSGSPCPGADGDADCSETCDEGADACTGNDPNGTPCDDALFCNGTDSCSAGICSHLGDPCPGADGDGDCSETCNEGSNDCSLADGNGSPCTDANLCTTVDSCQGGSCLGSVPLVCNDAEVCTADSCSPGSGCVFDPLPDADSDGLCDDEDNCPYVPNGPSFVNSDSLPAGDACQCGDVDEDGDLDATDVQLARELVVGATPSGSRDPARCDVMLPGGCGVEDVAQIDRHSRGYSATIDDLCAAYGP